MKRIVILNYQMIARWVIGAFLPAIALSISISVSSQKERCMIVSSNNQDHFLNLDLKFERFPEQALEEGYRVVLHNTETHQEEAYQVYEGIFRR